MNHVNDIRTTISAVVNRVRTDTGRSVLEPSDDDALSEKIGLDSLDLAVTVVNLERDLGVDPFREAAAVRTFGELVAAYEKAIAERQ